MTVVVFAVTTARSISGTPTFGDAVAAHLGAVHRYLTHVTRDAHLADDLTADTFERAFRNWAKFDPSRGGVLTWLIAIARNVAVDHARTESRRRRREDRYAAAIPQTTEIDAAGGLPPEMAAALERLSDVEREIVALRVLLDVDGPTTAQLLDITPTACSTYLHRAMTKLRKELDR